MHLWKFIIVEPLQFETKPGDCQIDEQTAASVIGFRNDPLITEP